MNPTKLTAIIGGTTYDIDGNSEFVHEGNSGFGMVPVKRLRQKAPMQEGETDLGVILLKRTVDLYLYALASSWNEHFTRRDDLLHIFRPSNDPVVLEWALPDGAKRRLDCYYVGELGFNSHDFMGMNFPAVVRLEAPDPLFYDPSLKSISQIITSSGQLVFPFSFPIQFESPLISKGFDITYNGSWKAYPTIVITGPGTTPTIENTTTGKKIELDYTLASAEVVTVVLTPGEKSIKNDSGTDLIGTITDDSDLADFVLEPDPEVADGVNHISLTITSGTPDQTALALQWHERFVGV